ncbi:hypothetical protein [Sediminitomix flava]|uniref:Uncharacterized protein n=1 Tax=Sediminitomix flava TaxID=379075 RepID=A0A315ZGF4_SEDFL|nr:hypothetical protein [Sediminitomix flava]PWJ43824.1 hypothetical protein BC781_101170 [Sediminitomix flava]
MKKDNILEQYKVEDFVEDESFQSYVLKKDQKDIAFWATWKVKHPEKSKDMEEAENLILLLRDSSNFSKYQAEVESEWDKFKSKAKSNKSLNSPKLENQPRNLNVIHRRNSKLNWAEILKIGFIIACAIAVGVFVLSKI